MNTNTSKSSAGSVLGGNSGPQREKVSVLSEYQRKLSSYYKAIGIVGLRTVVMETVDRQSSSNPTVVSWQKLKVFAGNGEDVDMIGRYVATMDRGFLEALIEGEVTKRCYEDQAFRGRIKKRHTLMSVPQIYVNICCRAECSPEAISQLGQSDQEKRKWAGWGLTPDKELRAVLGRMLKYTSVNVSTENVAKEVDGVTPTKNGEWATPFAQNLGRKHLHSEAAITNINEWVNKVFCRVVKKAKAEMDAEQLSEPLPWCFQEIGCGQEGSRKAKMHMDHTGTNYLFGLFTASLMSLYPDEFEIVPHAVMDVMEPGHVDGCEILASLISGSYGKGEWMGLNPAWAGGNPTEGPGSIQDPRLGPLYDDNLQNAEMALEEVMEKNWAEDKKVRKRFLAAIKFEAEEPELTKALEEKEEEAAKLEAEVARLKAIKAERDRHEALRARLKRHMESVRQNQKEKMARRDEVLGESTDRKIDDEPSLDE